MLLNSIGDGRLYRRGIDHDTFLRSADVPLITSRKWLEGSEMFRNPLSLWRIAFEMPEGRNDWFDTHLKEFI